MKWWFSVVRFVPDPFRGEFVNVGVIAGSDDTAEWDIRFEETGSKKRARAIDSDNHYGAFLAALNRMEIQFERHQEALAEGRAQIPVSLSWLQRTQKRGKGVVQLTVPAPILADHLDEAIERALISYVHSEDSQSRPMVTKQVVIVELRRAFVQHGLPVGPNLAYRRYIQSKNHRQMTDFVAMNGEVVQLCQAWSFQRPDPEALTTEIKSWAYSMKDLRQNGGYIGLKGDSPLRVPKDVEIQSVYLPPDSDEGTAAFEEALHAFYDVNSFVTDVDSADEVALRTRELLTQAGVNLSLIHRTSSGR